MLSTTKKKEVKTRPHINTESLKGAQQFHVKVEVHHEVKRSEIRGLAAR
jgi:hypothetical protein